MIRHLLLQNVISPKNDVICHRHWATKHETSLASTAFHDLLKNGSRKCLPGKSIFTIFVHSKFSVQQSPSNDELYPSTLSTCVTSTCPRHVNGSFRRLSSKNEIKDHVICSWYQTMKTINNEKWLREKINKCRYEKQNKNTICEMTNLVVNNFCRTWKQKMRLNIFVKQKNSICIVPER